MSDTRTHAGPTPAGRVLGSYRILHELTSGGMGTVFRAEHVLLGRPAAVKLLRRDLSTSPALVQRFVNEARAVTACKHPGIVEVYDFGYTEDGHAFIVMEFLDGESLGRRLARLRLAEIEAAAIAHGIASALRAAHRVGVIHRDLKPDNVFLVPDPDGGVDRTKVLDFGIAKLADSRNTQTGALIGTPLYMAPEQARAAAAIDHRADLYSLGCILYHMLTGRPPFVAEGAGEIIALQMFGQVVPPSQLAPVTPEMERLVLRLLDKDPAQRFGSAGEVAHALTHLDRRPTRRMTQPSQAALADPGATDPGGVGGVAVEPGEYAAGSSAALPDPRTTAAVPSRSALPLLAGTICVLAVAAVGVVYATHGDPAPGSLAPASWLKPIAAPPPPAPAPPPPAPAPAVSPPAPPAPTPAPPPPANVEPPAPTPAPPPPANVQPPAPVSTDPPVPPAPVVSPPTPPGPATPPAPPDGHGPRKHPVHKIVRGVGPITPPGARTLPERTVEVHRGSRAAAPPRTGDHTPGGAPLEDTVDLDTKPTHGGGAPRATSPPPKDPSSP
jgi:serine/threonine-protein kinase